MWLACSALCLAGIGGLVFAGAAQSQLPTLHRDGLWCGTGPQMQGSVLAAELERLKNWSLLERLADALSP